MRAEILFYSAQYSQILGQYVVLYERRKKRKGKGKGGGEREKERKGKEKEKKRKQANLPLT